MPPIVPQPPPDYLTKRPKRGQLLSIMDRLPVKSSDAHDSTTHDRLLAPPAPKTTASAQRGLGERSDGAVDLAAWRAKWLPIFKVDFTNTDGEPEGALHVFHDSRSNSLELMFMGHNACDNDHRALNIRHVLPPVDAMQMLLSLNKAYGFDLGGDDDDEPGPAAA